MTFADLIWRLFTASIWIALLAGAVFLLVIFAAIQRHNRGVEVRHQQDPREWWEKGPNMDPACYWSKSATGKCAR